MENQNELRIVSAAADKNKVVFYLEDATTLTIKQGDHRLGDLLDVIIPINSRGEVAVVSLDDFSIYAAFEKKTTGLTRFFKVAKSKVKGFFSGDTDTHETHIPEDGKEAILRAVRGEQMTYEEAMEHGKPMHMDEDIAADEVIVAVVTTPAVPATETAPAIPERKTVIPGVQSIKPLIKNSVTTNSTQSVQNFLSRCAAFIDKRAHSVDDLMRFLEKGDLPLAEDGSIIAYKMLNYLGHNSSSDTFVDCHTNSIKQKVGSYVCVSEELVDLNRRNECSNGLHIARRGYLSSFGGQLCVICKIDPEDVMVVPHNDANKVRVKGYHILGILSKEATAALKQGKPATSDDAALKLIHDAIKGVHVERLERVQVNGQRGTNVVITKLKDAEKRAGTDDLTAADLSKAKALDEEENGTAVDVRDINKRVTAAMADHADDKAEDQGVEPEAKDDNEVAGSGDDEGVSHCHECDAEIEEGETLCDDCSTKPVETASELAGKTGNVIVGDEISEIEKDLNVKAAQAILDRKKKAKKSWEKLGYPSDTGDRLQAIIKLEADTAPVPVKPKAEPKKKGTRNNDGKFIRKDDAHLVKPKKEKKAVIEPVKQDMTPAELAKKSKAEQARYHFNEWQSHQDKTGKENRFNRLLEVKKSAKKGWAALGFNPREIDKIEGK